MLDGSLFDYSLLMILASVVSMLLALRWWRIRRLQPFLGTGAIFLVCSALWALGSALVLKSSDLGDKITWTKFQYVGIVPLPLLWAVLVFQFIGRDSLLVRRNLLFLGAIPILTLVLALTNEYHFLVLNRLRIVGEGPEKYLAFENGPMLWFFAAYAFVVVIWAAYLLIQSVVRSGRLYRWRGSAMLLGMLSVMVASTIELTTDAATLPVSLTALVLMGTTPLFVLRQRAMQRADILPVAAERVVAGMKDHLIVLDAQDRVIDLNPAAARLIGCTIREAIGRELGQLWAEWQDRIDLLSKVPSNHEFRVPRGGQPQVYDLNVSELTDWRGKIISRVIVLRDITERVFVEDALRSSEEHFRALTENSKDIVFVIDTSGNIASASPSFGRAVGSNVKELVGKSSLDFVHPDDKDRLSTALAELAQEPKMATTVTVRVCTEAGAWRIWECTANDLLDHAAVRGIVINARDVSERVEAEERVLASLREKEILLKEIHHRVKNNLQVISSLLNLQSAKLQDPILLAQYQDMQTRVRSMALIHERLYRSDDLARVDFGSYLRDLTGSLAQTYGKQAHGITVEVDAEAVLLDIDTAIPCGLLVNELVSNAFKHAFPNGRGGAIAVALRREATRQLHLVVRDDGVGFPPNLDYRQTTSLGLQLVNSLVRQLGATVVLASEAGIRYEITFAPVNEIRRFP